MKGHAAKQQHTRVLQKTGKVIKQNTTQTPANNYSDCTIKNQIGKIIFTERQIASLDMTIGQKPGRRKPDQVGYAIPVDGNRAN